MGFYLRKSVSIGPLRLNLSGSGIGASVGIKGLRFGVGPSGTYVHAGAGGLYYRASLGSHGRPRSALPAAEELLARDLLLAQPNDWTEIESGNADLMVDASAQTVLQQLKRRHETTYWQLGVMLVCGLLTLIAFGQTQLLLESTKQPPWTAVRMAWTIASVLGLVGTISGGIWGYRRDSITRGGVAFLYELDDSVAKAYERIYSVLERIGGATVRYHTWSKAHVDIGKTRYHGGANTLIKTTPLAVDLNAPSRVAANVPIPSFAAGKERLCFFPERLIVLQGSGGSERIGVVAYEQLQLAVSATGFTLSSSSAPAGTRLIGHTWQFVNNNGTPDRRFKNNRQLAMIACENITFTSTAGLCEQIMHSSPGLGGELSMALTNLADMLKRLPTAPAPPRSEAAQSEPA